MLKPPMASPISLAPMTRHRTAIMTALYWPIQSRKPTRIWWDRWLGGADEITPAEGFEPLVEEAQPVEASPR